MRKTTFFTWACTSFFTFTFFPAFSQPDRWQQRAEYTMQVEMDVNTNQYKGTQKLVYFNNSPDTLAKVFYHLYFNAFQPNSMMDVRSRTIVDPDGRVRDRIFSLSEDEIGYLKVENLKQNGKEAKTETVGTILEVTLAEPILPNSQTTFDLTFEGQVPQQIRRSGRDNKEGVRYSMSQWYPKLAEYDYEGWHANPYIGREFHGVWGDFDVKITIDSSYVIGGSGYLQNPKEIGHGYQKPKDKLKRPKGDKLTWHFKAPNVHDFMWGADPDYTHKTLQISDGPTLHFFYQEGTQTEEWRKLPDYTKRAFEYINQNFGKYPYEQFSVVQGGDGGMEYPMSTLITGHRSLGSLVGVTVHEALHSWYQGVLATNEALYAWMDEGMVSYATSLTMAHLFDRDEETAHQGSYRGYFNIVERGIEEPLTTHADHFETNAAYGTAAYSKGAVTVAQLEYVIGQPKLRSAMKRYFDTWKFKHPNVTDFKRIVEKESGIELDWYFEHWVNTTNTIDYDVKNVWGKDDGSTLITLERVGRMMMPIDLVVTYKNGTTELFYIPLRMMRGEKDKEDIVMKRTVLEDWPWTFPTYTFNIPAQASDIVSVEIDPTYRMADVERENNAFNTEEIKATFPR